MIKHKLLSLFVALACANSISASICIDGIEYYINSKLTATVTCGYYPLTGMPAPIYSGDIIIPSSIIYEDQTYPVTAIGDYAFSGCTGLTSVTIPNSVTYIGGNAFSGCTGLTSITIPNSVTEIGRSAFSGCTGLTSITIPNSVTTIGSWAFSGCSGLTFVTIPNSVTTIGDYAFYDCTGLTSVTIGDSVTTIEDGAFAGCSKLKNVYYTDLFQGPSFPTYQIPSTARITCKYPINVTTIDEEICACTVLLTIPDIYYERYDEIGLSSNKSATAMYNAADKNGQINFTDGPFSSKTYYLYAKKGTEYVYKDAIQVSTILPALSCSSSSTLTSITFSNVSADTDESVETFSKGIKYNNQYYAADENNSVILTNIVPNKTCTVYVYGCYNGKYYLQTKTVSTKTPSLSCSTSSTQTTITLSNISASTDESVTTLTKGIYYDGKRYEADKNDCVVLTNIAPNQKCTLQVYGCYNGNYYYGSDLKYVTTKSLAPTITTQVTPTCIYAQGSYTHGDATILGTSMACTTTGSSVIGDEGLMTGLKPNTDYLFTYSVDTKEGGTYTATKTITTSALELTTLTPKVVSAGNVVVAASTNISDYETNVGFEWRKYNAPPELPSSRAQAILYSGQMEGILHNLSLEYWKVRAYYEAADGTCYYGEWATFDPSQPAFFEPTVHTYALVTDPTANKVQMRGYVMTGTDDVTEQGFEYWFNGAKAPRRVVSATPDSIYRVQASGQVMTAVLEDLAYSTTYTCRAYAIAGGKTYYGEEVQFLTPEDPRPIYTLSVIAGENGSVNTDVSGQYREGETVTLTATPMAGYLFLQWSDGNTDNPRQLTIMTDTELMAVFELADGLLDVFMNNDAQQATKFIYDGHLYILRDNNLYNATGARVK